MTRSDNDAKQRLRALVDELDKAGYTAAARCLADDLDALVVHLRYPPRHRRRWRSTNLLERTLGEVKRCTKVMGRFPGQDSLKRRSRRAQTRIEQQPGDAEWSQASA